jgi:hypothetical protein
MMVTIAKNYDRVMIDRKNGVRAYSMSDSRYDRLFSVLNGKDIEVGLIRTDNAGNVRWNIL